MSENIFGANGLDHEEKLRFKTTLGTQTEVELRINHPDKSIRSVKIDDRDKWLQTNHSNNERIRGDTSQQPRRRQKQVPSTEEKTWRAQEKKSTDQNRQEIIHAVSWDEDEELLAPLIEKGGNEIQTDENNRATNLPTTVEEEEGYQQHHIELVSNIQKKAFDSRNMRNERGEDKIAGQPHKTFNQTNIDETTDVEIESDMDKFFAEEVAIVEMIIMEERRQSSLNEHLTPEIELKTQSQRRWETEHIPISGETTMLQITCGQQERNNRLGYKRIGKAARMIALLRRCLYPKRDVIRWESKENEDICPRRIYSFAESSCPGTLKKPLLFRFVVLKASPTSVGKTKDSRIDFSLSSFLQL